MALFVPKQVDEGNWKRLPAYRAFAVRGHDDEAINIRLSRQQGFFLSISPPVNNARVLRSIDYATGEESILFNLGVGVPIKLGRTSECELKILHSIISRRHLCLTFEKSLIVVEDLGSTNGTYVHADNIAFDIASYLDGHPPDKAAEATLDMMHEAFGPTLDDFLKRYQEEKKGKKT